jgi:tRNA A-37 threonylcarbamoyl transferase component Bud32
MDNFEKKLMPHERRMTVSVAGAGILPDFTIKGNTLRMRRYPMTLAAYIETNDITTVEQLGDIAADIDNKIGQLHELGIVHMDLHTQNIVFDPATGDVRLIDLGMSRFINDLHEGDMLDCVKFLPGFCYGTEYKGDIMAYEYRMWKMDYF